MTFVPEDFIRAHTAPSPDRVVPELRLHLAERIEPLWEAVCTWTDDDDLPPPFWAFAWPGGQALARYLLDNPEKMARRRVLDFASGSGIAGLAAAKAGAKKVTAADCDEIACAAARMNAQMNGLKLDILQGLVDLTRPLKGFDLIMAGDVCYDHLMGPRVLRWLRLCAAAGTEVWLADPGRAYAPQEGVEELARMTLPTSLALEDKPSREVTIWRVEG